MATLEEKIDKIAENVSYMRGKYDEAIPQLQEAVLEHSKCINSLQSKQENMAGKASVVGGIMGAIGGVVLSFLSTKL